MSTSTCVTVTELTEIDLSRYETDCAKREERRAASPSRRNGWHCYAKEPIDSWDGWCPLESFVNYLVGLRMAEVPCIDLHDFLNHVLSASHAVREQCVFLWNGEWVTEWEGDVIDQPYVAWMDGAAPTCLQEVVLAWKQSNNGSTFFASRSPLPFVEAWESNEAPVLRRYPGFGNSSQPAEPSRFALVASDQFASDPFAEPSEINDEGFLTRSFIERLFGEVHDPFSPCGIEHRMACPICGFDYVHFVGAAVQEENKRLVVHLGGECDHHFTLLLEFHKGQMFASVDVSASFSYEGKLLSQPRGLPN